MSTWVAFRDWFCLQILPVAIGVLSSVLKTQAEKIPGLYELLGLFRPMIQTAYDKAVVEQDFKMQAILLAVLSKLFLVTLVMPGVEVLTEEDANKELVSMSRAAMDEMPEEKRSLFQRWWAQSPPENMPPEPTGN
jgi:hypothetical protein